jgi:hypothetical protein
LICITQEGDCSKKWCIVYFRTIKIIFKICHHKK